MTTAESTPPATAAGSLYRRVGIAAVIMMASVFLSRLFGFLRVMVIAYIGGASGEVDAYQYAFLIPEILNHLLASGFLSVTFIPIFSGYLAANREADGWRVFSVIMTCFGSLLVLLVVVAMFMAPELVALTAPGLEDPGLKAKTIRMTRIIIPAQLFFFAGGLFMAVQFAKERFLVPAAAGLVYNLGIIAGGIFLGPWLGMEGFAWGVLGGAFAGNFVIQYRGAVRLGMVLRPRFDFAHPDLKRYIRLTLPLMLGLTMTFSTEIFFRFFGSYLAGGGTAALDFGLRVMLVLVAFFGQALGTASFPFLARLAGEGKLEEMKGLLNSVLSYLALVIPFSVLFAVLRNEVVVLLFQRGRFDAAATALTARVLLFLMIGAFAFAAQTVVVRGFYALEKMMMPAVFGSIAVLLSLPLYVLGVRFMGAGGVALAVSLSAILQVVTLFAIWNRHIGNPQSRGVYLAFVRMILFSVPAGIVLAVFRAWLVSGIDAAGPGGNLAVALLTGVLFVAILAAGGYGLKIDPIRTGLDHMARRAVARFGRGGAPRAPIPEEDR